MKLKEDERSIIALLISTLPLMSDKEQGFINGIITSAAIMAEKRGEEHGES